MIIPCEIAVKSVIPAMRALMAKELVEKHGLRQDEVAELLGISQSAVSKYTRKVRGHVIEISEVEEVQPLINKMIGLLVSGTCQRREFLIIFCQTCSTIRKTRVMCPFCQKADPTIDIEECGLCMAYKSDQDQR